MTCTKFTSLLPPSLTLALAFKLCACDLGTTERTAPDTAATLNVEAKTTPVDDRPPAASPPTLKVQIAANLAREISVAPEHADKILRKHGLDRDEFDAIILEIASDPELTKAYMVTRRAAP